MGQQARDAGDIVGDKNDKINDKIPAGKPPKSKQAVSDDDVKKIVSYINEIEFGSVSVVIQNGNVMQIEKNEKIRLK